MPIIMMYDKEADASIRRSPRKRPLFKMPPPSSSEKLPAIPIPPQTSILIPTVTTTDTHLLPSLTQPRLFTVMEVPLSLRDLSAERILKLQADHEGSIIFPSVTPKDLHGWKEKHPQVIEGAKIRHEYSFLTNEMQANGNA